MGFFSYQIKRNSIFTFGEEMSQKYFNNLFPPQFAGLSGSVAVDYYGIGAIGEEQSTIESTKEQFIYPTNIPSLKQLDWAFEWSHSEDINNIEKASKDTTIIGKQLAPVIHFKTTPSIKSRFLELQQWEGIVLQVLKDSFVGRLIDLTHKGRDEEAEFSYDETHIDDQPLIKPGAIFYWTIGYLENRGQRIRASVIRFRRVPTWKSKEIEAAKRDAEYIRELFHWK